MRFFHSPGLGLAAVLVATFPSVASAQWALDGAAITTAVSTRALPTLVADGSGGAILTWHDYRNGASADIYAQRIDASGVAQWPVDGVALCTATGSQLIPKIVADGSGGAVITWQDFRNGADYDIYAQRIDAAGVPQWTANGVALCTATATQQTPTLAPDGAGGAVVTWRDFRNGTNHDIYAQRVDATGTPQWTANGVALCTAANDQTFPVIVSDASGGAIVTWYDFRSGTSQDIYAQRINTAGTPQWTTDGVGICTANLNQTSPTIATDAAGGAIITWQDFRSGTNIDIYAQRISASGTPQWTADGVSLCGAAGNQLTATIVADGFGGGVVAWYDQRVSGSDIYAQRITASGVPAWTDDGVAVCAAAGTQVDASLIADGTGGAIVAWRDLRTTNFDVYAQHVDRAGFLQWATDGAPLCTAVSDQTNASIIADGAGGGIVAWQDTRTSFTQIYAQRVEGGYGYWGHPEPIVASVTDIPNDQGGKVAVNWTASGRDRAVPATIGNYTIWRAVDVSPLAIAASASAAITPIKEITAASPPGTRIALPRSPYFWELVGTQNSFRLPFYTYSASTRADSVPASPGDEFFMVAAHDRNDPQIAFFSNAGSGHSVDNLAPSPPLLLTAERVGADVHLQWNGVHVPDLKNYAVYRATAAGVTPVPGNFLASSADSVLVDSGAPGSALHYIVTALDVHANQSAPSNEAAVSARNGVGNLPPIAALTVMPNHPNPFGGETELTIGLPAAGAIVVEVYDVTGRRVRTLEVAHMDAGWRTVAFGSVDDAGRALASGVYFYRVKAGASVVTRKMVVAR